MKRTLDSRRSRIARINAKRPPYRVEIIRKPEPGAREHLIDVLFELLDPIVHGERK